MKQTSTNFSKFVNVQSNANVFRKHLMGSHGCESMPTDGSRDARGEINDTRGSSSGYLGILSVLLISVQNVVLINMLCNASFDSFCVGTIYYINLFAILEVVERRDRSYTLPFHQFGSFWRSIANNFQENGISIFFTKIFELGSNYLTWTTPAVDMLSNKLRGVMGSDRVST